MIRQDITEACDKKKAGRQANNEKINIIKGYTDNDMLCLTGKQKEVAVRIKAGDGVRDIAQSLNCSCQNVHSLIDRMTKQRTGRPGRKTYGMTRQRNEKYSRGDFENSDLSILSERERQVISLWLKFPDKTYRQIGEELGITVSTVGKTLFDARKKLSGEKSYYKKTGNKYWSQEKDM